MDTEVCKEVLDILQMFRDLQFAYDELDTKVGVEPRDVIFPGFDGNNETKQLGYARYVIEEEKRFDNLKYGIAGDGLNSQVPTLDTYRRMLSVGGGGARSGS